MKKALLSLAQKMQVLKKEDKENFLTKIRNCAILFNPNEPKSIPLCPVEERMGYKIDLIRSLYRKLEGEPWIQPTTLSRFFADTKKLNQINEQELRQKIISEGVAAYCESTDHDKLLFEQNVRKTKWLAVFMRKKDKILDYDFI